MKLGPAVLLTALAGTLVAMQAPVNGRLRLSVGTFQAAAISFAIGLSVLVVLAAVTGGGLGAMGRLGDGPWWMLIGGLLGAAYVSSVLVTVRTLGAGAVVGATIAGQLTMSVVIDHFGWLGVARHPVTAMRVVGVVLLGLGVFLVVRD